MGYLVILLAIINIFKGFDILNPEKRWEYVYIGVIAILAIKAVCLEAFTWYIVLKRRKSETAEKTRQGMNGANGANGHVARPTHV